ncbi:hypothetical protein HBI92_235940 [Parastagonospora nodorum]|nr:hypothetical protein HBI92_235940 [Parastagonospora nodorum]
MPPFWTIGTLFGASSVMLGAFGAHGLKKRIADPARIANWGTAAQYQGGYVAVAVAVAVAVVLECGRVKGRGLSLMSWRRWRW